MSARATAALALALAGCAPAADRSAAPPALAGFTPAAWSQACKEDAGWDDPGPPFHIHGNSYYVGTCGITAILIAGDEGHIVIDGGTKAGGALIAANIARLGFNLSDVKILLHSHEHFDHVAGLAELQRRSGARLLASSAAAPVLASGREAPEDPQAGVLEPFPSARVDGLVVAGQAVRLGSLALMPLATPGHTAGALTWQWQSCEGVDCRTLVYTDSLSPVSNERYKFGHNPDYLAAYRASLARVAALDCDVLLTPHPSASGLYARAGAGLPADPAGCRRYGDSLAERLEGRLAQERAR